MTGICDVITDTAGNSDLYRRWWALTGPVGRNELPEILWNLFQGGEFTLDLDAYGDEVFDTELLALAVENTWSGVEYPQSALDGCEWAELFISAGEPLTYPEASLTLYRGARHADYMRGMSWTSSPEVARWFGDRYGGTGLVYWIPDVGPTDVLAQIVRGRDGEDEYVLDPEYLDHAPIEIAARKRRSSPTRIK